MECSCHYCSKTCLVPTNLLYIGVTDDEWVWQLTRTHAREANFWRPGNTAFHALPRGGMFLFKLKASAGGKIVGGGHFVEYLRLPVSVAWNAFGSDNGVSSHIELIARLTSFRDSLGNVDDPEIGCIVLEELFFFDQSDWIEPPTDWKPSIVSGKSYPLGSAEAMRIVAEVRARLSASEKLSGPSRVAESPVGYALSLGKRRLGQGAFRALVTQAYSRRCAITGEKTLPALDAAHIRPVEKQGQHVIPNGLLLRSDIHRLFDRGLISVTPQLEVRVSPEIRVRYENGRDYYALNGRQLVVLPEDKDLHPDPTLLAWHQEYVFVA